MSTPRQPSEQPSEPPSNGSSKSNMTSKEPVTRPQAAVRRELKNLHSTYRNSANRSNLHSIEVDVDLDRSSRAGRKSISQNPNIYSQRLNRKRKIDTPVGDAVEDDDEPYDTSQVKPLLRTSVSSSSFYGASRKSFFNADIGQNSAIFEPGEDGGGATSSTSQLLGAADANREEVDISRGFFHVDPTRRQQSISIPEGTPPSESSSSKGKDRQLPILDLPVPPPDSTTSHFTPEITIAANKRSPIKKTATIQKSKRRSELSPSGDGLPLAIPTLTVIPPPEEIEKSGTGSDLSSPLSHVSDSPEGVPRGIEDDADVFAEESKSVSNDAHSEIGTGTSTPKTTAVRGRGRGRGRGRPRGRAGMVRDGATSRANSSSRAGSARLEAGSTRGRKRKRSGTPAVEERRSLPKRTVQLSKVDIGQRIEEKKLELTSVEHELQLLDNGTHPALSQIFAIMDNDWQFKKRGMIRTQEVQEVWLADQLRHKENAIWAGWRVNVRSLLEAARNDADMDKSGLKIEMETIDEFDAKNEVRGVEGVQKIFPSPVAVPVTLDWHKRLRPDQNGWQLTPTEIENDMILFQAARESAAVEARRNEGRFDQVMHAQDIANSRPRRVPKDEAVVKESTKDRPLPKLQPKTPMPQPNLHIQPQYQSMLRPIQTKPVVPRYSHAELRTHVRSQLAAPSATSLPQPHNEPPPTSIEAHPESQLHGLHPPPEPFPHPHTHIAHHFQPQLPTELLTQPQTGIHPQPQTSVHLARPHPSPISPSVHSINPIFNFHHSRSGDLPISNRLDSDTKLPHPVESSTTTSVLVSSQGMQEQDERTRSESDTSGDSGVLRITKVQLPAIGQEIHSGKDKAKENSDDDGILTITRLT